MAADVPTALASLPYFAGERRITSAERLTGGLQNVNYKVVTTTGEVVVVRIPSTDAREHGQTAATVHASTVAAGACGVGPEVCAFDPSSGVIVTRFLDGRALSLSDFRVPTPSSSAERSRLISCVVATIRRLHKECKGMELSQASDVLRGYNLGSVPAELRLQVEKLQGLLHRTVGVWDKIVCCHNDLDPSNIIVVSNRAYLVDWEWSGPGDRVCDIATFCDLCNFDEETEQLVLSEYFGKDALLASRGLLEARLQLWRLWFAVRGSLWAAVKAGSSSGHVNQEEEAPCDYAEYAATGWKTVAERMGAIAVARAMQRVTEALGS